eukprot:2715962-Ditylum_brightwellii.AAC.1
MYAFVTARPDIGYSVAALSKFSLILVRCHHTATRRVFTYMRQTKDWGLIYWRLEENPQLGVGLHVKRGLESHGMAFIYPDKPDTLAVYVDAAHAKDLKTRRYVGAYVITLGGTAVTYRSKLQPTVSTSSTEADFVAAVSAAKIANYLRYVFDDLGMKQEDPKPIYEDNAAVIMMANAKRPTEHPIHIDIQFFPLQESVNHLQ